MKKAIGITVLSITTNIYRHSIYKTSLVEKEELSMNTIKVIFLSMVNIKTICDIKGFDRTALCINVQ